MALKTGTLIIGCEKGSVEVMLINYLSRVKVKKKRNIHEKLRGVFQTIVLLKQLWYIQVKYFVKSYIILSFISITLVDWISN